MVNSLLITDYQSNKSLNLKVDCLIINSNLYSTFNGKTFSLSEIIDLVPIIKTNNYQVIINCDRIIPENEVLNFKKFINKILKLNVDYIIYSDYSILSFVSKEYYDNLIYDPKTLVCTKEELEVIPTKSFISSEISLDEIKNFNDANKSYCLDVFGYRQMMYSRRPLLSLCLPKGKVKSNVLYDLSEETRDERYKIFETKRNRYNYGTFVYNKGIFCIFDQLKDLKNISLIRLNSMFLEDIIDIISEEYYKLVHNLDSNFETILKVLDDNKYTVDNTFLNRESVLLKEGNNE